MRAARGFKNLLILFIVLMFMSGNLYSAEINLIQNSSMEQGEGNPSNWGMWGWQMKNTVFKLDNKDAHTGKICATIINSEKNDARFIQEVLIENNQSYKISGWIKTKNIGTESKGACISVLESSASSRDIKGTNGKWEYVEFYVTIGKGLIKVTVTLGIGGYGDLNTGEASFDDVSMVLVKSVPAGMENTMIEGQLVNTPPPFSDSNSNQLVTINDTPNYISLIVIVIVVIIAVIIIILVLMPKEKKKKDE